MTVGDVVRKYGPVLTAAFALGVALTVGTLRAIDEAARSIGKH